MKKYLPLRKIVAYISRGISPKYVESNGLMVLNQKCIRDSKIHLKHARYTSFNKVSYEKKLQQFDILINSTGVGTLGRVAQLKQNLNATVDSHITILRLNKSCDGEELNPTYIGCAIRAQENHIEKLGKGATGQTELSRDSILNNVHIFLPNYKQQSLIASIISSYDDLIENNEKRIKLLEEMAQRLYAEWFVKFKFPGHEKVRMVDSGTEYGMIPEGWAVKKLGDIIELAYGKALVSEVRIGGDFFVYGSSGIVGTHNESIVDGPGIVVGRKGNVGSVFWAAKNFYPIDTTFYVKSALGLHFIFYLLKAQCFISGDAAVPGLNRGQAYSVNVIVPEEKLITFFSEKVAQSFMLINTYLTQVEGLKNLRNLLISNLINGSREIT